MAWHSIDPWLKGWTIGFLIGLTQPLFYFIQLAKNINLSVLIFPTYLITKIVNFFSICTSCSGRGIIILFSIPLIFGLIGMYIGIILYGVKGTVPEEAPVTYVKEKYF